MNSSLAPPVHFAGGAQPHDSREWRAVIPALLGVVCLAGVAGNACVIGILLYSARRGKPSLIHALILNLSLADLLLLLFAAPLRAAAYSRSAWTLGWFVCKTSDGFSHTCMAAKSLTTAVVAKACFMYASNPAKQVSIEARTICAVLLATWLVALVSSLPLWLFSALRELAAGSAACVVAVPAPAREFMAAFVKLYPLLVFCAPLLCAFLYFWRAYGRCQRRGTKTQNLRNQIRSRRLTVMLLSVTVTLAVMWLPEWISWLWVWHLKPAGPAPPEGFLALTQTLMFTISSANPLIFLVMSEEFREGFKGLWKRLTLKKPLPATDNQEIPAANSEVLPDSDPSPEPVIAQQERELPAAAQALESLEKKEMPVFPDVEQFWHDREAAPDAQDNDPIPWEHEEQETVGCDQ
ncbi:G-protein coupled receptor 151 [Macrochelys suwanniensis]